MGVTYYFGRRITTTDSAMGTMGANSQRFYTPNDLSTTIIAYRMGFLGGKIVAGSNPTSRLGIAQALPGGTPDDLLAYTNAITVTNAMSYGGDGAVYESDLTAPILMSPGKYSLGATAKNYGMNHAMIPAASISATDEDFYYKTGIPTSVPTDPVGGSASNEGHMDVWVIAVTNTAPSVPNFRTPSGSVASGDLTPILEADFNDAEETLPNGVAWDYVEQVQVIVRRKSDGVTMWNYTYSATPAEQTAAHSSIEYAGSALTAGIDYEWQIRHSDRAGAWSDMSTWLTFNINPGGTLTPSGGSVSGKQLTTTPGPFASVWTHAAGLSANAAEVRIKQGGSIVRTMSGPATVSVAPAATVSISWATSAFAALTPGVAYTWEMRARDTASAWSPWTSGVPFTINAIPLTPSGLSPSNSQAVSSLPKLSAQTSDPDDLTSSLTMQFEITRSGGSIVTVAGTYNATTGKHEFQTTATELPSIQTFTYRARSYDGTFYSAWSGAATVVYGNGPVVTITSPAEGAVVIVSTPTFTWTATGQVSRRVRVYELGNDVTPVVDSTNQATAVQSYTVPSGKLRTDKAYYVIVDVTNSVPLMGSAQALNFTIDFVEPPAPADFVAYPRQVGTDSAATAIDLSWSMTTYPAGQFVAYDLYRYPLSGTVEDADDVETHIRRITSPLQTAFTDFHPRSGVEYEYRLRQIIRQDLDELESTYALAQSQIRIDGLILASALEPSVHRIDLVYLAGSTKPKHELKFDQRQKVPVGARRGRTIRGSYRAWQDGGRFNVVTDQYATAEQRIADIREAVFNGKTFSLRDYRGRKRWVTVISYDEEDFTNRYEVSLQFREEHFIEGETL